MNLAERIQHFLLIGTFFILIVTGLPVFFYDIKFLKPLFSPEKSFYIRGIIHRVAAVVMILNLVWHILYTIFTKRGRDNFKEMIPKFKDIRDAFEIFWHHAGLTRFLNRKGILKNFFSRYPYWLFENVSGFLMWKVELSLSLFPLWVHDIFIILHGYEAILAFLAVIIWHMYNVHLNPEVFPMSKIWLNGKITGKELRVLHPLEYQKILEERQKVLESS